MTPRELEIQNALLRRQIDAEKEGVKMLMRSMANKTVGETCQAPPEVIAALVDEICPISRPRRAT